MGENYFAATPTAVYGVVLLMAAIAYWILQRTIIAEQGDASVLATAVGNDVKGKLSQLCYLIAIPTAFFHEWISGGLYVLVALVWLVPDRRIERVLAVSRKRDEEGSPSGNHGTFAAPNIERTKLGYVMSGTSERRVMLS